MSFVPIDDDITFIRSQSEGKFPYSNALLVQDEYSVLIDTGVEPALIKRLSKDCHIDLVINSHCHEDHIAGNQYFPNSKICAHKLEAPAIRSVDRLIDRYGLRGSPELEAHMSELAKQLGLQDSKVDVEFEEEHVFHLGNIRLQVLHTPGHSSGHCSFFIPEKNFIYLSDIDLTSFGPWYGAVDSHLDSFITSIERLTRRSFDMAVTSHRSTIFTGREKIRETLNQYLNIVFQRERKLLAFLNKERTLSEIVNQAIVYWKFPEPVATFKHMEKILIQKHLERLLAQEAVDQTQRGFKRIQEG